MSQLLARLARTLSSHWKRSLAAAVGVLVLLILAAGVDPTWALILSQVILSFGIPFALIPLVWLTSRRDLMGVHTNRWWTTALGVVVAILLVGLNITLLVLTFTGAA